MNIVIFSSTIDTKNGYGNITYELCSQLARKGINFTLLLPASEKENRLPGHLQFEIRFCLPEYIFRIKTPEFLSYLSDIDLKNFTLVHSLFDFPYCVMAARLAKKYHLPFIMGVQGTYGVLPLTYWPEKYLLKRSYRQAQEIIVPSAFTKAKIEEYSNSSYHISIIHNGVNFQRFRKRPDIREIKKQYKDREVLLTVGGLKPRKGQDLVIKSLLKVKSVHPEVKYLIVGEGRWQAYLNDLVKNLKLTDYVEFLGNVEGEELVKYFHLCDVYVHTPRVANLNFEGFGIVYLEASACGKPIVATDAGGVKDAVINGQTGLIAESENENQIAEHIISLLNNPRLAKKLGRAGIFYAQKHDWSDIADKFIEVYKKYI